MTAGRSIDAADLRRARELVQGLYEEEACFPGSPVTTELVQLNLEHVDRVRRSVTEIAEGEGLDAGLLQLAAILHDVCKLDHRDVSSGGIDTWHHHHRGASLARKLILTELGKHDSIAAATARLIETHSDIPFIRRYWTRTYRGGLPTPETPEELALRDGDVIDLLWVGGISKIVHFRQVPGSEFYREDGGDIRNSMASAKRSFEETSGVLSSATARGIAVERISTVHEFFERLGGVRSLEEFTRMYDAFIANLP
jgi:hypothetical protein